MSFAGLVFKNLLRQPVRTSLAALGIAIGITTVVALGSVTSGLRASSGELITVGGADFMVGQKGASDMTFSAVSIGDLRALERRPDVEAATGVLLEVAKVRDNPYFILFGYEPAVLERGEVPLVRGRLPAGAGEVALGEQAVDDTGLDVGGVLQVRESPLRIVGVYRAPERLLNGGGAVTLAEAQRLSGKQDIVTLVHVRVAAGADPVAVAAAIERDLPELTTIASTDEISEIDQGYEILDAANLAISLLALGIGAIGVMNTMIMSVYERTREIGILRAVGWRGSRILRMIVAESLFLCLLAAVAGVAAGIAASRAVLLVPAISTFLTPMYPLEIFLRAVAVGVLVALVGAAYPAVRAVRLSPMEALRHE